MFVIEATNLKKWRWISGIFEHRTAAELFFNTIPAQAQAMQRIVDIPLVSYPVFIIEDDGFEYGDVDFVKQRLLSVSPKGDEDHIHLNIYAVTEDFSPAKPGSDSMGGLLHWHITDWALQPPRSVVLDEELSELANIRYAVRLLAKCAARRNLCRDTDRLDHPCLNFASVFSKFRVAPSSASSGLCTMAV